MSAKILPDRSNKTTTDTKTNKDIKISTIKEESTFSRMSDFATRNGKMFAEGMWEGSKSLGGAALDSVAPISNKIMDKFSKMPNSYAAGLDNKISKMTGGMLKPGLEGLSKDLTKGLSKNISSAAGKVASQLAEGDLTGAFGTIKDEVVDDVKYVSDKIRKKILGLDENKPKYERPDVIPLPRIIGLPPLAKDFIMSNDIFKNMDKSINLEAEMTKDTFPILEIIPCKSSSDIIKAGLDLYRLIPCWTSPDESVNKSYYDYMRDFYRVDVGYKAGKLKVACLHDSPINESFTNDFRDSIFQGMAQGASSGFVRDLAQMTNVHSLGDAAKKVGINPDSINGIANAALGSIGITGKNATAMKEIGQSIMESALGHGLDFPQVWATSGYQPNYSFTVRLYNPYPGDPIAIDKYIIGPLTVLLSFVVPRSDNGHQFFQPWMCKIRMKGLIPLTPCYMSNVSIVKGGDQNQIGWNQKSGIVDVKLDFKILYKVMVATKKRKHVQTPQLIPWLNEFVASRGYNANDDKSEIKPLWYRTELKPESLLSKISNMLGVGEVNKFLKGTALSKTAESLVDRTAGLATQFGKQAFTSTTSAISDGMASLSSAAKNAYVAMNPIVATDSGKQVLGSTAPPTLPPTSSQPPSYPDMGGNMIA